MFKGNRREALQKQITELQREGIMTIGYSNTVFNHLDTSWLLTILEQAIENGIINQNIKRGELKEMALQFYIDDIDIDDNWDLKDFRNFNEHFMNYRRHHAENNN